MFRHKHWILKDGLATEASLKEWAEWFETAGKERIVAQTEAAPGIRVSTVFLGLDHNWLIEGSPILWETMIFGGPHDQYQERYSNRADAEAGHLDAVALAITPKTTPIESKEEDG